MTALSGYEKIRILWGPGPDQEVSSSRSLNVVSRNTDVAAPSSLLKS